MWKKNIQLWLYSDKKKLQLSCRGKKNPMETTSENKEKKNTFMIYKRNKKN